MGKNNFQYDETGSTYYYVFLTFLGLILLPATYYFWPGDSDDDDTEFLDALDDHGSRVKPPVWTLYQHAIKRFGNTPTLIEWDNDVPSFDVLWAQRTRFQSIFEVAKKGSQRA